MNDLEVIEGRRPLLENEIIDMMMASFKPGFPHSHEYIMSQVDRLEPAGKLEPVTDHAPEKSTTEDSSD